MRGGYPPSTVFRLDGTETTIESPRATMTLKAEWTDSGKTLHLKRVTRFDVGVKDDSQFVENGRVTVTTTEDWSLSADGKRLTVRRFRKWLVTEQNFTLVFKKK